MFCHSCFQNSDHGHGWKDRPYPTTCSSAPNFRCIGLPWTPHICFPGRLPHPIQGSVMIGVRFYNSNVINRLYRIIIVTVAVSVPLLPVLTQILIVLLDIIAYAHILFRPWWWVLWHAYILCQRLQWGWSNRESCVCKTLAAREIDAELVIYVGLSNLTECVTIGGIWIFRRW